MEIVERYPQRDWDDVARRQLPRRRRAVCDGAETTADRRICPIVPSPFLEGVFVPLMAAHPRPRGGRCGRRTADVRSSARSATGARRSPRRCNRFELERIYAEAEWIAANGIDYLFIADANFGILPRDVEIAEAVVAAAKRHGYPKTGPRPADEERDRARLPDDEDDRRRRPRGRAEHLDPDDDAGGARGDQAPEHLARDVRRAPAPVRARRDPDLRRHDRGAARRDTGRRSRKAFRTSSRAVSTTGSSSTTCRSSRTPRWATLRTSGSTAEDGHDADHQQPCAADAACRRHLRDAGARRRGRVLRPRPTGATCAPSRG